MRLLGHKPINDRLIPDEYIKFNYFIYLFKSILFVVPEEMTTAQQGYGPRYQKIKSNKLRSLSPNHYQHDKDISPSRTHEHHNSGQTQLGKVVAQLADRIDGVQIKIVNITNIIKLFQKYTETKDIQYQKQKENDEFRKNIGSRMTNIESLEIQNKINEMQAISKKAKAQMTAMQGLRVSIQRQHAKKTFSSPQPFETVHNTIQSPTTDNRQVMEEIEDIMDRVEASLREEMNKKFDICMNVFKNAAQQFNRSSTSPSTVNAIMMQEQLHNMTLTVNKVESDCHRNKMLIQNKIQQIINYVTALKKKQGFSSGERQSHHSNSRSANRKTKHQQDENLSQHSSISKKSKKSKSKSKSQSKKNIIDRKGADETPKVSSFSKIEEQKKQKQIQLKQALRKKKENQEKLKMKR